MSITAIVICIVLGAGILNMFIEMASGDDSKEHLKGIFKSTLITMTCVAILCAIFVFLHKVFENL